MLAGSLLLISLAGWAQDEVKLINNSGVLQGKIIQVQSRELKLMMAGDRQKALPTGLIDSVYCANDSIMYLLMGIKNLNGRLKTKPLAGDRFVLEAKPEEKIQVSSKPSELKIPVSNPSDFADNRILESRLNKGGSALKTSGGLILGGIALTIGGAITSANKNPDTGMGLIVAGGLLQLVGYGNLIYSGKMFMGNSSAKYVDVGLGMNGAGMSLTVGF